MWMLHEIKLKSSVKRHTSYSRKKIHNAPKQFICWDIYSALHCSCVLCILNYTRIVDHSYFHTRNLHLICKAQDELWWKANGKKNKCKSNGNCVSQHSRKLLQTFLLQIPENIMKQTKLMNKYRLQTNSFMPSRLSYKTSTLANFNIFNYYVR